MREEPTADAALAALETLGGVGLGTAIVAMLVTRPTNTTGEILVSISQAIVNRWVIPVIERHRAEGHAAGLSEGRAAGLLQGRLEARNEWRAWTSAAWMRNAQAGALPSRRPNSLGTPG